MLRFRGRQTASYGMTLRPGRLYSVRIVEANSDGAFSVMVSGSSNYCFLVYDLERFMADWELPGERAVRNV